MSKTISRRQFLQIATVTMGGAVLAACGAPATTAAPAPATMAPAPATAAPAPATAAPAARNQIVAGSETAETAMPAATAFAWPWLPRLSAACDVESPGGEGGWAAAIAVFA